MLKENINASIVRKVHQSVIFHHCQSLLNTDHQSMFVTSLSAIEISDGFFLCRKREQVTYRSRLRAKSCFSDKDARFLALIERE